MTDAARQSFCRRSLRRLAMFTGFDALDSHVTEFRETLVMATAPIQTPTPVARQAWNGPHVDGQRG
jgi:hypothetical protein